MSKGAALEPMTAAEKMEVLRAIKSGRISDPEWAIQNLMRVKHIGGHGAEGQLAIKPEFTPDQAAMFRIINDPKAPTKRHIILKARQVFMTTLVIVVALYRCATQKSHRAIFTSYNEDETRRIFQERTDFICRNSPLMKWAKPEVFNEVVKFPKTGSRIEMSMSPRGQNPNYFHLSDYAKCCRLYPAKAREIRNGSLQASEYWPAIIESTSEGSGGVFYDTFMEAWDHKKSGRPYSRLNFMPHFFAWWTKDMNRVDPATVELTPPDHDYFDEVEHKAGTKLDLPQRAWYISTLASLNRDRMAMMHENPSTPEEAFKGSSEGKVLLKQVNRARLEGRVDHFKRKEGLPVICFWDFGSTEYTAYIACQYHPMNDQLRVIDAYKAKDRQLKEFLEMIERKELSPRLHVLPHDATATKGLQQMKHSGNRPGVSIEQAFNEFGWNNTEILPKLSNKAMGFLASRQVFDRVCIDSDLEVFLDDLEDVAKAYDTDNDGYLEELVKNRACNHLYDCFEAAARVMQEKPKWFFPEDPRPLDFGDSENEYALDGEQLMA